MARYKFRLATLLQLRRVERDERRAALSDAQRQDDLLAERLHAIVQELATLAEERQLATRPGSVNLLLLRDAHRYQRKLAGQQAEITAERRSLAAEIEERRQALVEADTAVRALEKLRESGIARQQAVEFREETRQLDEVGALQAFDRLP